MIDSAFGKPHPASPQLTPGPWSQCSKFCSVCALIRMPRGSIFKSPDLVSLYKEPCRLLAGRTYISAVPPEQGDSGHCDSILARMPRAAAVCLSHYLQGSLGVSVLCHCRPALCDRAACARALSAKHYGMNIRISC